MMENFEKIKEGLLVTYGLEELLAKGKHDFERVTLLGKAMDIIESMDTKTDLLQGLTERSVELLKPIENVEGIGGYLRDAFRAKDLIDNNVFIDRLPTGVLPKDSTCILINSTPHLMEGRFAQDVSATIIGKWYLEVQDADVTLLQGAHVNLWGSRAMGQCLVENASMIRRQEEYYQPIRRFDQPREFREVEDLLSTYGRFVMLDHIVPDRKEIPELSLSKLSATATSRKGDEILTNYGDYTLVRNEWERSYTLFERYNVHEVIDRIKAADYHLYLDADLSPVLADVYRGQILRMPGERWEIGQNTKGEPVTLWFDANTYKFKVNNLCPRNSRDESLRIREEVYMDWDLAPRGQLAFIKTRFEGRILPRYEQKTESETKGHGLLR